MFDTPWDSFKKNIYIYIAYIVISSFLSANQAPASRMCYANELSRPPISGLLELFSRMHQGERERSCSPPLSVFVCSLPAGRPESCGSTRLSIMRCFFYFYTAGVQLCTHDASPAGLLMDGIAWAPSATRWRWTLAFVNWGISRFRFCPLRLGRRVHQSGLTIGKCQHSVFEAVSRKLEGGEGAFADFLKSLSALSLRGEGEKQQPQWSQLMLHHHHHQTGFPLSVLQLLGCKCGGHRQQDRASNGRWHFVPL